MQCDGSLPIYDLQNVSTNEPSQSNDNVSYIMFLYNINDDKVNNNNALYLVNVIK